MKYNATLITSVLFKSLLQKDYYLYSQFFILLRIIKICNIHLTLTEHIDIQSELNIETELWIFPTLTQGKYNTLMWNTI